MKAFSGPVTKPEEVPCRAVSFTPHLVLRGCTHFMKEILLGILVQLLSEQK